MFGNVVVPGICMLHVVPPTRPEHLENQDFLLPVEATASDVNFTSAILVGMLKLSVAFTDASGNRFHRTWAGDLRFTGNVAKPPTKWRLRRRSFRKRLHLKEVDGRRA